MTTGIEEHWPHINEMANPLNSRKADLQFHRIRWKNLMRISEFGQYLFYLQKAELKYFFIDHETWIMPDDLFEFDDDGGI